MDIIRVHDKLTRLRLFHLVFFALMAPVTPTPVSAHAMVPPYRRDCSPDVFIFNRSLRKKPRFSLILIKWLGWAGERMAPVETRDVPNSGF